MKVKYFKDTDTLYIEFQAQDVVESRYLDENTIMDLDAEGASTNSMVVSVRCSPHFKNNESSDVIGNKQMQDIVATINSYVWRSIRRIMGVPPEYSSELILLSFSTDSGTFCISYQI